jgi:hypothetical protein
MSVGVLPNDERPHAKVLGREPPMSGDSLLIDEFNQIIQRIGTPTNVPGVWLSRKDKEPFHVEDPLTLTPEQRASVIAEIRKQLCLDD